jgi:hypothetical protein
VVISVECGFARADGDKVRELSSPRLVCDGRFAPGSVNKPSSIDRLMDDDSATKSFSVK